MKATYRTWDAGPEEQGLSRDSMGRGLRVGGITSVPVALALVSGVRGRSLRGLYRPVSSSPVEFKDVLVESVLRIPLVTALLEELIFRGGLLGLASHGRAGRGLPPSFRSCSGCFTSRRRCAASGPGACYGKRPASRSC